MKLPLITALITLTAVTAFCQTPTPVPAPTKKVLFVVSGQMTQTDRWIVEGLEAKGVGVDTLAAGPIQQAFRGQKDDPKKGWFNYYWQEPDLMERLEPTIRFNAWTDDMLAGYRGVIFSDAGSAAHAKGLPTKLANARFIVYGEAPKVEFGKKALAGETPSLMGKVPPYTLESGFSGVAYTIWTHTWWREMEMPTDEASKKFIDEQLVPAIVKGL